MRGERQYLFMKGELGPTLDNVRKKALEEVEAMDANRLLQVSETDLVDYLMDQYSVEPICLTKDQMYVTEPKEVDIDVTGDPRRFTFPGERAIMRGVAFSVVVPFSGTEILFYCRPQTFTLNPPAGRVEKQNLYLDFQQIENNGDAVKQACDRAIADIEQYLQNGEAQVKQHNEKLEQDVRQAIARRKKRLLDNQGLVSSLGLPVKRRDVPDTYSIPMKPRKPRIQPPTAPAGAFKPEPALPEAEYEHILEILGNMAVAMERSPRTFAKLDEE
ncbi:MAG TPA: hypothetical protein VNA25_25815, partial [Phycisphaerae bacterium]|nr:hypothetical protein [Phycisphaerae bacterium]